MDHPLVRQTELTGYPNLIAQPEHSGFDFYGDEILIGDEIAIDKDNNNIILKDNLEKYLFEELNLTFKFAE